MSSTSIQKDLQIFQASVKKLSSGVGKASTIWNDSKLSELSTSVSQVAAQSKQVMVTGERLCSSIDKFDRVANEKY